MRCRRQAGIVALVMLPALPLEAAPGDGVPFTLTDGGAVIVPVFLEGSGPHPFVVDTGANGSTVARGLAGRMGLTPVAKRVVVTPAGDEMRVVVNLGRVSVGGAAAAAVLASIVDTDRLRVDGAEVDGVLGQDFLSRFDYTIDYRRRVLVWEGAAAGHDGVRLPLRRSEGRFLVDVAQPGGGDRPFRFVPDSGANGLVVFERPGGVRLAMDPLPGGSAVESASGRSRAVEMRRVPRLRIGSLTLRDQVAAVVSRPEADAPEGDGLLPLHQFASVTFGSQAGYLVIRAR
jgi:predicted aspartyl protease